MNTLANIWDLSDEQLNAIAPMHGYLGADQFSSAYNLTRRAFAMVLAEDKTPVIYDWDGDFNATPTVLKSNGIAFREVCGICWVDDFAAALQAVTDDEQTSTDGAVLIKIEL